MNLGETTVQLGDSPTLGPAHIHLYQPPPKPIHTAVSIQSLLTTLISEARSINQTLTLIHNHLTRPPWWKRAWERIKSLCGIHAH